MTEYADFAAQFRTRKAGEPGPLHVLAPSNPGFYLCLESNLTNTTIADLVADSVETLAELPPAAPLPACCACNLLAWSRAPAKETLSTLGHEVRVGRY